MGKPEDEKEAEKTLTEEQRLYQVPEELKVRTRDHAACRWGGGGAVGPAASGSPVSCVRRQATSDIRADPDEDLGGAPMLHGTGILEVALPMDFKIKCIEVGDAICPAHPMACARTHPCPRPPRPRPGY